MAEDYILPVRRAVLPALKAFPPLLELIPAASMWPSTVPASRTFPFTRFGSVVATPFRASGLDSSSLRVSIQAFTKALMADDQIVATAEDQAFRVGSAIKDALDGRTIALEGDNAGKVRLAWIASSPQRDGAEADAWMTTVTFQAEVAG
jgi:hypothetical protein